MGMMASEESGPIDSTAWLCLVLLLRFDLQRRSCNMDQADEFHYFQRIEVEEPASEIVYNIKI
jgi:hypothetical protein